MPNTELNLSLLSCWCRSAPLLTRRVAYGLRSMESSTFYRSFSQWTGGEEKLLRSVLILVGGMLLFSLPTVIYKIRMLFRGILYFCLCWDKSWKKPVDPGSVFGPHLSQNLPVERKTIYFVRHGESTWNETFNKGNHRSMATFLIGFIPGLIKSALYELYLLLSGKLDRYVFVIGSMTEPFDLVVAYLQA